MYKWNIRIWTKNSDLFEGFYESPENSSGEVAKTLFVGSYDNFVCIFGEDKTHNLFVKLSEIEAFDISVPKESKDA